MGILFCVVCGMILGFGVAPWAFGKADKKYDPIHEEWKHFWCMLKYSMIFILPGAVAISLLKEVLF